MVNVIFFKLKVKFFKVKVKFFKVNFLKVKFVQGHIFAEVKFFQGKYF